jgi:membrane-bound serine protease (ClpP class)
MLIFALLQCPLHMFAQEEQTLDQTKGASNTVTQVVVIPIEGMIGRGLLQVVERGLNTISTNTNAAVVIDMNTPGGRVDVTETIMRKFLALPDNIRTFTFIREDALSAGALIAVSTHDIYMTSGARIGASAIVGASGDIEEGDLKEKHVSALTALVRSAAHENGHDPELFESMIRRDMEYSIDGEIIVPEGQLLALSNYEAERMVGTNDNQRPLLSAGTVESIEEMLTHAGIENFKITRITVTQAEKLARWIEMFAFLFLAGGLLGIYIEFRTPGFGVPGLVGIILLAIFFWGHRIAGLSGDWQLVVFLVGVLLLLAEIFLIPGFGIAGISGIGLMLLAIFFSMAAPLPKPDGISFQIPAVDMESAVIQMGLAFVITLGVGSVITRYLPKAAGFRNLVLDTALLGRAHDPEPTASEEDRSQEQAPIIEPNMEGITTTALRPSGYAKINNQRIGVVAEGAYLDAKQPIVVRAVHGNQIVVAAAHKKQEKQA